ncbi:helix-turn-helix domain-containing protein [Aureimonas glaciei]|uniref:helix-turn-helix domain-containing protein n=1 Tax=Aureimonas glaciei TaxID=1776957 RepID=UPI00166855D2|nr:AraC family transcriptional regulator [Aureimonas glaciei]
MQTQKLFDGSAATVCPISVPTRHSQIGIFRHRSGAGDVTATSPEQDAHLVIMQLVDHPAHSFWAGGDHVPMPASQVGDLSIVGLRHEAVARFSAPVDSLHIHLPHVALDDLTDGSLNGRFSDLRTNCIWERSDVTMRRLQPILVDALENAGRGSELFIEHMVTAAAAHVLSTYGSIDPAHATDGSVLAPWQVRRAKEMMTADLGRSSTVSAIAEACGLSSSHFARAFKNTTGTTPVGWLQGYRIDRARDLLLDKRMPLSEVALRCGFADQSHFTRMFKRATGIGPGAWRRSVSIAALPSPSSQLVSCPLELSRIDS